MQLAPRMLAHRAVRRARRWRARGPARRLGESENPALRAVGLALSDAFFGEPGPEARRWYDRIEARRRDLLASDAPIAVVDYGAGSSTERRTASEMRAGKRFETTVADVCRASKPADWARFLASLVLRLRPRSCLELGTCVGISASYLAAALRMAGDGGRLVTLEGSPGTAKLAGETLAGLGLTEASVTVGPFHETYRPALAAARPVDFLFNDGHHDHDALLGYFEESLEFLADDAVVAFDDISWSPGMRRAWNRIERDERVAATVDLRSIGIAVLSRGAARGARISIPL